MFSFLRRLARSLAQRLGYESPLMRMMRPLYLRALNALALGRGVPVVLNGVTYRVDARHLAMFIPDRDPSVVDFLQAHVRPGSVCYNVGANVGLFTLQLAHWSGPTGRVVAFEPNPFARADLSRHVEMNGLGHRVQVVDAAVGATPGTATLHAARTTSMSSLTSINPAGGGTTPVEVRITTLDEFCRGGGPEPDWLFMDIEGFEIAALKGASELIKRRGAALRIVTEFHPAEWPGAGTSRAEAEAVVAALGLRVTALEGQRDPMGDYGHVHLAPVGAPAGLPG